MHFGNMFRGKIATSTGRSLPDIDVLREEPAFD
jgi:hypothetical protein